MSIPTKNEMMQSLIKDEAGVNISKDVIYGSRPSIGQKVRVQGKIGIILNETVPIHIKFEDGSFGFFEEGQIEEVIVDTRLKSVHKSISCGFCSSINVGLVKMNNDNRTSYTGDAVYQCYKCGNRFGISKL